MMMRKEHLKERCGAVHNGARKRVRQESEEGRVEGDPVCAHGEGGRLLQPGLRLREGHSNGVTQTLREWDRRNSLQK